MLKIRFYKHCKVLIKSDRCNVLKGRNKLLYDFYKSSYVLMICVYPHM